MKNMNTRQNIYCWRSIANKLDLMNNSRKNNTATESDIDRYVWNKNILSQVLSGQKFIM